MNSLHDWLLLAAERLARQVYFGMPALRRWVRTRRARRPAVVQRADRGQLLAYLREVGVRDGALVMVHSSISGMELTDATRPDAGPASGLQLASQLVHDLMRLVGDSGTLVMPVHPVYQSSEDYLLDYDNARPVLYDPERTPCAVGLVNELFWRRRGVERSLHPFNPLAAVGPLASELLRDNLHDQRPLPHGVDSGYYRCCQQQALIVSIGVPLHKCLTLHHVAEEVRDQDWPIPDFFEERTYRVRIEGEEVTQIVRQPRMKYTSACLCPSKLGRDLLQAGILHAGYVDGVRVDWARANEVLDFMLSRNRASTYPYYWTWTARRAA